MACACIRLSRLAAQGLCCGPACDQRRRWNLSQTGKALAESACPVLLDDLDRSILAVLARSPLRLMALTRRTGRCRLTVRRRLNGLIEVGLVVQDVQNFSVTPSGIAALGDAPHRPAPWLRVEAVAASTARDVIERRRLNNLSASARSALGHLAAQRMKRSGSVFGMAG